LDEVFVISRIIEVEAIEHFFGVYIASSKHSGAGRILESYATLDYFSG